jgi:diaminohydroxyphosphoribosylaminopyrimidine deaminase/5-amino-6-(5-phosphoribosylamino)uracil reductase
MKSPSPAGDELFMRRAMELALNGLGSVSPNPMVGCVLVRKGLIVGEGWHMKYGEAHAEVQAMAVAGARAEGSTAYVNLEPCSHFGKTPPCADLLVRGKVKRVVISNRDPNPEVNGKGIEKLRTAGIEVQTGVLEREGRQLNRRFFLNQELQRPYVILKWAETADGFLAKENLDSKWISNTYSRRLAHRWRAEEDAVLVGTRTAFHDNPQLTVRDWVGRNPVRIVIDRFLRLPEKLRLFDRSVPTLCYNVLKHEEHPGLSFIRVSEEGFVAAVLGDLRRRNIGSLIVEGGKQTLDLFIEQGLWDEARIFRTRKVFGKGVRAPRAPGIYGGCEDVLGDDLIHYHRTE